VKEFRDKLKKVVGDKHEDVMTRFGAILANGIMDAGGRNSCATFYSKSGMLRRGAAIGFCLFSQMWYWFPLIHMFSLTLTPTALIGLNDKLKIPKNFSLKSSAKPSIFAYPEPLQPPKKEDDKKAAVAVLSTAAKAKQVAENKEIELKKSTDSAAMDVDADGKAGSVADGASVANSVAGSNFNASIAATPGTTIVGSAAGSIAPSDLASDMMEVDDDKKEAGAAGDDKKEGDSKDEKKPDEEKKAPEAPDEVLKNPCRVLPSQRQFISFPSEIDGQAVRYVPMLGDKRRTGFLLLGDQRPDEPEDLFLEDEKREDEDDEKEPDPPEPFEWTEADMQ